MSTVFEAETTLALQAFCELIRKTALHGQDHSLVHAAAVELRACLERARPPFALQIFGDAFLRDRAALRLELETFRRAQQLAGALRRWGAHELLVEALPPLEALIAFSQAVVNATHANRTARRPELSGLRVRALWRPLGPPSAADEAALETFAQLQVERVRAQAQAVCASEGAWPWADAEALCARLERATRMAANACARALELEPPPWPVAHGSAVLAFYVGAVLQRMQVAALPRRAAVHAALCLGCAGLAAGLPIAEAAQRSLARALLRAPGEAKGRDPHQLRTCALLHALAKGERAHTPQIAGLVAAAYAVERMRLHAPSGVQPSRVDLHAFLASALGGEVHAGWGRALLLVLGLVPAGAYVLADGRLGVALGPGRSGDVFRPRVLVGGAPTDPAQDVKACSPLAHTPWAR